MNKLFLFCVIIIFLSACQAAKDGLTQKKRSNADEFLVEKKNPLVLPPTFGDLPSPDSSKIEQKNEDDMYSALGGGIMAGIFSLL